MSIVPLPWPEFKILVLCITVLSLGVTLSAQKPDIPESLVLEARSSVQRGANFLVDKQLPDGSWVRQPSVTALCAIALSNSSAKGGGPIVKDAVEKARKYILAHVRPDGSITPDDGGYVNYTTSICLSALAILGNPADKEVMRAARHFLLGEQITEKRLGFLKKKYESYRKVVDMLRKGPEYRFLAGWGMGGERRGGGYGLY